MKKIVASAIVLGLLGGPVFAQKSRDDDPIMIQERDKQQQAQALDKQYKRTLDQTRKEGERAGSQRSVGKHARTKRRQTLDGHVNRDRMIRFAAVLVGAGVLFAIEQELGAKLYVAIPAGILAYIVTLVGLGLVFGSSGQAK